jgi:hypothetical protein
MRFGYFYIHFFIYHGANELKKVCNMDFSLHFDEFGKYLK